MQGDTADEYPLLLDDGPLSAAIATDAAGHSALRLVNSAAGSEHQSSRPASKARVNGNFLRNVVRDVEGHNAVLLRREREERLGFRKHPLVDKIREIEREKLERGKRERRRSKSPRRMKNDKSLGLSQDRPERTTTHGRESDAAKTNLQVRGRGSKSTNILDLTTAITEDSPATDDAQDCTNSDHQNKISARSEDSPDQAIAESKGQFAGRDWDRGKQSADDKGTTQGITTWKCGAGYL